MGKLGLGLLSGPLLIISDLRKEVGVLLGYCSLLGLVESGSSVYCVSVFLVVGFVGCALVLDSLVGPFLGFSNLSEGVWVQSGLGSASPERLAAACPSLLGVAPQVAVPFSGVVFGLPLSGGFVGCCGGAACQPTTAAAHRLGRLGIDLVHREKLYLRVEYNEWAQKLLQNNNITVYGFRFDVSPVPLLLNHSHV